MRGSLRRADLPAPRHGDQIVPRALADDREGVVEVGLGVGEGDEAGLVGGGGEVDALVEAAPEELFEDREVLLHHVVDVDDVAVGEEEAEHRADAVEAVRDAFFGEQAAQAGFEVRAELVEAGVAVACFSQLAELGEAGGHGERVAGEGAGLIDGAVGGEHVHDVGAAAEGADREAAADDLAEAVRSGVRFSSSWTPALPRRKPVMTSSKMSSAPCFLVRSGRRCEVAGFRENEAGVGGVGLDDDGGDLLAASRRGRRALGVVVGEDDGVRREVCGHAGGVGLAVGECAGAGGDEQRIDVAVVAAVELDDEVAFGEAAGEADGGHGGLGAGVAHADLFDGGHPVGDGAAISTSKGFGMPKEMPSLATSWMVLVMTVGGVAEDVRAPGADVVDVGLAIDVLDAAALGAADEERFAADVAEGADGRVDAAGDEGLGSGEELAGKAGRCAWREFEPTGARKAQRIIPEFDRISPTGGRPTELEAFQLEGRNYIVVTMKAKIWFLAMVVAVRRDGVSPPVPRRSGRSGSRCWIASRTWSTPRSSPTRRSSCSRSSPGWSTRPRTGGRKLGVLKKNTKATLVGFTERAYKIQGQATHAGGVRLGVPEGAGVQGQGFRREPQEGLRAADRGARTDR